MAHSSAELKAERERIGALMRESREKLGKSQDDVASELGYSQVLIAKWESGQCSPSPLELPEVAKAYGTRWKRLLILPRGRAA